MAQSSKRLSEYLESEIARGAFPGAQYVVGERGQIIAEDALGYAVVEPERIAATVDTIYDIASLTKPLVTSLLAIILSERGVIDLNAPISDYLSEFKGEAGINDNRPITLKRLLTHTSGLPNWRPLYLEAESPARVPAVIARIATESREQSSPLQLVYSDLNYILLGVAFERATGERLDHLARREIFEPLDLKNTMFNPPPELKRRIAATERGQEFEQANALALIAESENLKIGGGTSHASPSYSSDMVQSQSSPSLHAFSTSAPRHAWREDIIWGEVHDGNAYFMGGVSGHAGLFSTAREVFRIADQVLQGSQLVKAVSLDLFTENLTPGFDTARSIGWILASTKGCSAGPSLPPTVIGHNGFTGTSVWMDPGRRRMCVLLTNRVHPKVSAVDIKCVRQRFNTLAMEE